MKVRDIREMMMQCTSCGSQIRSDARFCISCGAPVSQGNQAVNMPPPQNVSGPGTTGEGWQSPIMLPAVPTYMQGQSAASVPPVRSGRGGGMSMGRKVLLAIVGVLVVILLVVAVYAFSHQSSPDTPNPPVPTIVPPRITPPSITPPEITPPDITPPALPPPPSFGQPAISSSGGV